MITTILGMLLGIFNVFLLFIILFSIITMPLFLILYFAKREKKYLILFQVNLAVFLLGLAYVWITSMRTSFIL